VEAFKCPFAMLCALYNFSPEGPYRSRREGVTAEEIVGQSLAAVWYWVLLTRCIEYRGWPSLYWYRL